MRRNHSAWVMLLLLAGPALAERLEVISFNVESGGSRAGTIAAQISDNLPKADLYGFSEIMSKSWAQQFAAAAGKRSGDRYRYIFGSTGDNSARHGPGAKDYLAIVYNTRRLEWIDTRELHEANSRSRSLRSPLVARFRLKSTRKQFLFMVNHLARGDVGMRHKQARVLNSWVRRQNLPVIAVGDYNFDWDVKTGEHDRGYRNMTRDGYFKWVKPQSLSRSHCSARYNSILDFVFVSKPAQSWPAKSRIHFPSASYCKDPNNRKADHRPVSAVFDMR